jgi:hypothetical protein
LGPFVALVALAVFAALAMIFAGAKYFSVSAHGLLGPVRTRTRRNPAG